VSEECNEALLFSADFYASQSCSHSWQSHSWDHVSDPPSRRSAQPRRADSHVAFVEIPGSSTILHLAWADEMDVDRSW